MTINMEKEKIIHRQCISYGCPTNKVLPGMSFFKLPLDNERRREWLNLVGREDLLRRENLKPTSYQVCSLHFEESSMVIIRKLKNDAVPTKFLSKQEDESTVNSHLHNESYDVSSEQTTVNILSDNKLQNATSAFVENQTVMTSDVQTQTPKALSDEAPKKRALTKDAKKSKHKRRRTDSEFDKAEKESNAKNISVTSKDAEEEIKEFKLFR